LWVRPILIQKIASILRLTPHLNVQIPPDVIEYVQEGRNPDIYTREFVELAMRNNQRLRGKMDAFAKFRDVLAREVAGAVPALRADVEKVVVHTGGDVAALDRDAGVQIKVEEG
jgi:mediator of RNA polymerase II transcription subunit 10